MTSIEWEYRYKALRQVFIEQHPRLSDVDVDAMVDERIAEATALAFDPPADLQALGEPGADTRGSVQLGDPTKP